MGRRNPVLSMSTKLWPGRPACIPLPSVPYAFEVVPSSSRNGVFTPLAAMSLVIWSRLFITMGRTVTPALASCLLFSISAICTRQEEHPAPSEK